MSHCEASMDDDTPPKRVTRARAAAKAKAEPELKITTAAAKAKATKATTATSTKRKTRADDAVQETTNDNLDEDSMDPIVVKPKTTRGRPKRATQLEVKAVEEEAPAPVASKATKGRPRKAVEEMLAPEPTRTTRGRAKKAEDLDELAGAVPELIKKTTRGRAATTTTAITTTTTTTKAAAPKKSVKFEELDKENILPCRTGRAESKDAPAGTGLRAKPVRKPAATTRSTRGRAKTTPETVEKSPLSPKKATQVSVAKESFSEDELAIVEKTVMKPLMKSPVKAPGSVFGASKKPDYATSIVSNRAILPVQDLGASLMTSPARKPHSSPFKEGLKISPKRNNLGDPVLKAPFKLPMQPPKSTESPLKEPLLQSPARRPPSPTKVSAAGSPSRTTSTFGATPKVSTFSITRYGITPRTLTKSVYPTSNIFGSIINRSTDMMEEDRPDGSFITPFSGRLSAVLPRHADPALRESTEIPDALMSEANAIVIEQDELITDLMDCDPVAIDKVEEVAEGLRSTTPTQSPPRHSIGGPGSNIRAQDSLDDSGSEDELASTSPTYSIVRLSPVKTATKNFTIPSTPSPLSAIGRAPKTEVPRKITADNLSISIKSQSVKVKKDKVVFTPLSRQFTELMAADPERHWTAEEQQRSPTVGSPVQLSGCIAAIDRPSPGKSGFFDDEMSIRESASHVQVDDEPDDIEFAPTTIDEEDLALAEEADEMSLIAVDDAEEAEAVDILNQSLSTRSVSEASQEYGDENAMPIDPALLVFDAQPQPPAPATSAMATPVRILGERREREFHTVFKVPLKPAGLESPSKPGMGLRGGIRCFSASRLPIQRTTPLPPTHLTPSPIRTQFGEGVPMYTPTLKSNWSTSVTPVRTPRRDLNNQTLKGAVVYVDVHTTEGADASAVFLELLGQMGAKCVKTWSWNLTGNNSSPEADDGSKDDDCAQHRGGSKIGITHVVFKDGGKRTLEKVRESNGVVLCVGVGWVLDCERTNSWISELPYAIDTSLVPRGGHRRRKSMEPRTLQNLNGTLSQVSSTTPRTVSVSHFMSPTSEFLNLPDTPNPALSVASASQNLKINRRKSTQWVRSPESDPNTIGDSGKGSPGLLLSPIQATPAPEMISAYAEHILDGEAGGGTPYFLRAEDLVQRTAPPKQHGAAGKGYGTLGFDLETRRGNASADVNDTRSGFLMQRLLAARRKSLQWAPKVGSPLARGG